MPYLPVARCGISSVLFFLLPWLSSAQKTTDVEPSSPTAFVLHKDGRTYTLRYASNHPLTQANRRIRRLIVYIHGAKRNAVDYYGWGLGAVKADNKNKSTLLIGPQFPSEGDLVGNRQDSTHLFWDNNGWRSGDASASSKKRPQRHAWSSFEVIDSLVQRVCASGYFPKLQEVIIIGHSAGGQFVTRYAGMTPLPQALSKYAFRFGVMNPSSYLYFDERRPVQTPQGTVYTNAAVASCPNYNDYPKGVQNLIPYAAHMGAETIRRQFFAREVFFVLGDQDINPNDSSLDKSCSGQLQGAYRRERGQLYYQYLQTFADRPKNHHIALIPGVAHDGNRMINNPITRAYLFR